MACLELCWPWARALPLVRLVAVDCAEYRRGSRSRYRWRWSDLETSFHSRPERDRFLIAPIVDTRRQLLGSPEKRYPLRNLTLAPALFVLTDETAYT